MMKLTLKIEIRVMLIAAVLIGVSVCSATGQTLNAETNETYRVEGIDVACGAGGAWRGWQAYLIGTEGDETWLFNWSQEAGRWMKSGRQFDSRKVISYKLEGCGHVAFCADYDDDVFWTEDGGHSWRPKNYPMNGFNRCFATIEILNTHDGAGRIIFVGCEPHDSLPTASYTDDWGYSWYRLGGGPGEDPMYGISVNDIESMVSGELTAGTVDGLFRHDSDYGSPWTRAAFDHENVTAIDNIDVGIAQQVAAVSSRSNGHKLYFTSDGWRRDIREITPEGKSLDMPVRDLSAIYWGESNIGCYLATDMAAVLIVFNESDPRAARMIDLGLADPGGELGQPMAAVDYLVDYADASRRAEVIIAGPGGVYKIREYRRDVSVIDSITFQKIIRGTFWAGGD